MIVDTILEALNPAQKEAVTAPLTSLLILAGAGSGKTRVLVHRIAWLMQHEGLSPHSIMAVTFTNKAAGEMRYRIQELINLPPKNMKHMWVGTFHSLAHRFLRLHHQSAGLSADFQIIDQGDQLQIIKRLIKETNLDDKEYPPKKIQWYINGKKDSGLRPQYVDPGYSYSQQTMLSMYLAYHDYCKKNNIVDFGELLLRAHELLLNDPNILRHYRERFRYVMVDEFQDTNDIQYAWLRLLTDEQDSLMVVGDDDQSIYGWRGANIQNIQNFLKTHPSVKTIKLEQNYRSTTAILQAANAVIGHNSERLGKNLWTENTSDSKIKLRNCLDEIEEANFIGEQILEKTAQGESPKNIAILYRSNAQSRVLEQTMLRFNIPYRIYGGQRFFERTEIKNALAYMRLINNPHDNVAIERIINIPNRGIGTKTVEKIKTLAQNKNISIWQSLCQSINDASGKINSSLNNFTTLIQELTLKKETNNLSILAEEIFNTTGLMDYHKKEKGEKGLSRVENLNELITACRLFDPNDTDFSEELLSPEPDITTVAPTPLTSFLASTALDSGDTQADPFSDSIQMMTLHAAKGLEFPIIFLTGLEEKLFPHSISLQEGNVEEERRLCYVGITRTKKQLYLTYAENRNLYGEKSYRKPSRFIEEIPDNLIEKINNMTVFSSGKVIKQHHYSHSFPLGHRVHHNVFGKGVVLQYEGSGEEARIHINFDTEGTKWLMLAYANLANA